MIYQEFNLVPALTAVDNIVLGNEPVRGILLDERAARHRAAAVFTELGISVPLNAEVGRLSVAQQQMIEIAKVLSRHARIIVMDEPSAALTDREIDGLFAVIAHAQGPRQRASFTSRTAWKSFLALRIA